MSPKDLPNAYLKKCQSRLRALQVLMDDKNYSDVVREAQEIVELTSKGILRIALIDPPHRHDVAAELKESISQLGEGYRKAIESLASANHWLRREREMAFYGADDFDPTEGYSIADGKRAFECAENAVDLLNTLLSPAKKKR
jgi:HEPN domain-containing protein